MISRCTRKARQDRLSCSTLLGSSKLICLLQNVAFMATTRGIALTVCSGWQEKGFGIFYARNARDLCVDVSFGTRSIPTARTSAKRASIRARRIRRFGQETRSCQAPPVQRRSTPPEHVRSPDLEHSTHFHETSACCGSVDLWRISRGKVYHHCFALHHKKLSQHLVYTRKSSPSILCFCATTLCKPREFNVPADF